MTDQLILERVRPPEPAVRAQSPLSWFAIELERACHVSLALIALFLLSPLMMALSLVIWVTDGRPIFFGHTRIGRLGEKFQCWKFRSMVINSDQVLADYLSAHPEALAEWKLDHKLRRDPRITRIGRFLRASSLDELPQLWNVIVGEMNLVGPRPIVFGEIERYKEDFSYYCKCRPGITGLWQISGRNDVPYDQRVALDVRYAKVRSPWLDLKIMLATLPAVIRRKGCY